MNEAVTDFTDLITRLESASVGSPDLDHAIRDALDLPAVLVPPDGGDEAREYTTSIDAALTLGVPSFRLASNAEYGHSAAFARLNLSKAATVPLAVCIAALRYRMAT